MSIDAVVFDIGNVLIEWQPERHYDTQIGAERRRAMFEAVDLHAMNDLVDQGHDFRITVERTAARYRDFEAEILMWYHDWIKMATPEIPHSVKLMRALRSKGVPVFALTNFGIESFEFAETQYPFLTEFDRRYISGRMGCVKPHPLIFEMVEKDCRIAPERLLFTDDRHDNIATAEARGWRTHLFEGPDGWAARLVAEGLLSAEEASA
ncbi:HAD family hydrolase [Celeribacter indicus]|uniref:HAD-superfamily hydrolase n=1 Tax=Celeribacter indicus TaxID=1208324 RepID=A0A0B5DVR0_9RHOB|nr:HAD family phosphatase [Celeribacter indicus]AJE45250.1 HAD-superfamily hydrolase [Celeribacter indicus]SDX21559.1 2-haloacid dehalogenase [Celeribacter indicus]